MRRRNGSAYNSRLGIGSATRNRPIAPGERGPCCQDSPTVLPPIGLTSRGRKQELHHIVFRLCAARLFLVARLNDSNESREPTVKVFREQGLLRNKFSRFATTPFRS